MGCRGEGSLPGVRGQRHRRGGGAAPHKLGGAERAKRTENKEWSGEYRNRKIQIRPSLGWRKKLRLKMRKPRIIAFFHIYNRLKKIM